MQWYFAAVYFHVLSHLGIYAFFSLVRESLGYNKKMIGVLWAESVVVESGWFFTQSRWLPRLSLSAWLVVCAACTVLRMGLTAAGGGWLLALFVAQSLHALTFAAHHTVCIAMLSHHFPARLGGRGQALYTVNGHGCTRGLGSIGGGVLSSNYGLTPVFWTSFATSLIATGCAFRDWRHRNQTAPATAVRPG